MNDSKFLTKMRLSFFAIALMFFCVSGAAAQTDSTPKKRLKNSIAAKGSVGGEAHDGYVIRARKNQKLTVQIAWQGNSDRAAQFVISRSTDFFAGGVLEGGRETYDGKNRTVKIPATGDYYIYVTGHPTVDYTIKVSVK